MLMSVAPSDSESHEYEQGLSKPWLTLHPAITTSYMEYIETILLQPLVSSRWYKRQPLSTLCLLLLCLVLGFETELLLLSAAVGTSSAVSHYTSRWMLSQ